MQRSFFRSMAYEEKRSLSGRGPCKSEFYSWIAYELGSKLYRKRSHWLFRSSEGQQVTTQESWIMLAERLIEVSKTLIHYTTY